MCISMEYESDIYSNLVVINLMISPWIHDMFYICSFNNIFSSLYLKLKYDMSIVKLDRSQ